MAVGRSTATFVDIRKAAAWAVMQQVLAIGSEWPISDDHLHASAKSVVCCTNQRARI